MEGQWKRPHVLGCHKQLYQTELANLRAKCCSENWGHAESKSTGVNEIWLISAEIHHCQSAELPVLPNVNSSLLVRSHPPGIPCASVCVCAQAENTAERWHFHSIAHNESNLESKQSPKFVSDNQVYPSHSSMNLTMMVIFTLFEILCYVRYFHLPLLNTQH